MRESALLRDKDIDQVLPVDIVLVYTCIVLYHTLER
jgi:hypothetical protein